MVESWFNELGRQSRLNEWQLKQCVQSVQLLLKVAKANAYFDIDWVWAIILDTVRKTPYYDSTKLILI